MSQQSDQLYEAEDVPAGGIPWPVELLAATLDNLPAMVAMWDGDQRNVYANPAYASWLDRTPVELRTSVHARA